MFRRIYDGIIAAVDSTARGVDMMGSLFSPMDPETLRQKAKERLAAAEARVAFTDGERHKRASATEKTAKKATRKPAKKTSGKIIIEISGKHYLVDKKSVPWLQDSEALRSDWEAVGNDIRKSINRCVEESSVSATHENL